LLQPSFLEKFAVPISYCGTPTRRATHKEQGSITTCNLSVSQQNLENFADKELDRLTNFHFLHFRTLEGDAQAADITGHKGIITDQHSPSRMLRHRREDTLGTLDI